MSGSLNPLYVVVYKLCYLDKTSKDISLLEVVMKQYTQRIHKGSKPNIN